MFPRWVGGFSGRVGGFPWRVNGYPRRTVGGFPSVDNSLEKVNGCWLGPLCQRMTYFWMGGGRNFPGGCEGWSIFWRVPWVKLGDL